jgi:hypothetical protein
MWLARTGGPPVVVDSDDWEAPAAGVRSTYPGLWRRWFDYQERWLLINARAVTVASRTLQTQAWGMGRSLSGVLRAELPTARFREAPPAEAVAAARIG